MRFNVSMIIIGLWLGIDTFRPWLAERMNGSARDFRWSDAA